MIFIFFYKINFEFLRLKLTLEFVILSQSFRELFLSNVSLCSTKEFFHNIRIHLSFKNFFYVTCTVLLIYKARMPSLWFHHLWGYLMQFLSPHVITLMFDLREQIHELFFPWSYLIASLFAQMLFYFLERFYLMLIQTGQVKHLHAFHHLIKLHVH